jgi:hypothetical protein
MNQICLCSQQQELHYYFLWFDLLKQNNWIAYGKELNCFIILIRSDSSNRFDIRWCQTIKLFHKDKYRFGFGYFFCCDDLCNTSAWEEDNLCNCFIPNRHLGLGRASQQFLWFDLFKQNNWIAYGKELNCFIILVRSDSSNRFNIRWCQTIKLFHKDKSRFGFGYFLLWWFV